MSTQTTPPAPNPPPPAGPTGSGGGWVRPAAVVASCLVIGFVGGWILRGDDGTVTVLDPNGQPTTTAAGTTPSGNTSAATDTAPGPTTAATPPAAAPPPRAEIGLAVLNGVGTAGLAGQTAAQAEAIGYSGVIAGDAPTVTDPTTAYFRPGARPAARRVARDLEIATVAAIPTSGPIATAATAAAPDAQVVVVLGPG